MFFRAERTFCAPCRGKSKGSSQSLMNIIKTKRFSRSQAHGEEERFPLVCSREFRYEAPLSVRMSVSNARMMWSSGFGCRRLFPAPVKLSGCPSAELETFFSEWVLGRCSSGGGVHAGVGAGAGGSGNCCRTGIASTFVFFRQPRAGEPARRKAAASYRTPRRASRAICGFLRHCVAAARFARVPRPLPSRSPLSAPLCLRVSPLFRSSGRNPFP